jgi:hypothetical protein
MINNYSMEMSMRQRQNEIENLAKNTWKYSDTPKNKQLKSKKRFFSILFKKNLVYECCDCC